MMKIKLTIGRTSFQTDMRLIRIISIHNSMRLLQTKIVRLEEQEAQNSISMETGDQMQPPYKCHSDHRQPGSS